MYSISGLWTMTSIPLSDEYLSLYGVMEIIRGFFVFITWLISIIGAMPVLCPITSV